MSEDSSSLLGSVVGSAVFLDAASISHQILFEGFDTTYNLPSLWVTDGTVAGTVEVGGPGNKGVTDANQTTPMLLQGAITSIGSKGLFFTENAAGNATLWVSDGTTAGTVEVGGANNAGVANAPSTGLGTSLQGITSLGKRAIFVDKDSAGNFGLWSTDGTAAGTVDLSDLGNTNITGIVSNTGSQLTTSSTAAYSGIIFFVAANDDLYETDGTAAGTFMVGDPTGSISDIASFVGGAIYESTSGGLLGLGVTKSLWATTGASNNFTQVGGANNAGVAGAPMTGLDIIKEVSFGNDVLFTSLDSLGGTGLWITDGTASGTIELGGLKDAGVTGAGALGLMAQNLTVSGNYAYFSGLDSNGKYGLWKTDGTVAGTQELSTTANTLLGLVATEVQGIVSATPLGDVYNGGGMLISNATQFTNYSYLNNTGSTWDTATTSNDVFSLNNANLSITGGGNTVNFVNGNNAISLYQTGGNWDTMNGSGGAVTANNAQVSVLGGGDYLYGANGSTFSLYQTNGNWDTMSGSNQNLILNGAQASVSGANNVIAMTVGSYTSLYQTNNNWDTVDGSGGNVILNSAQATIYGGSNVISALGGSSMSLYQTVNNWDLIKGSGATVTLNQAQASVFGGSNTLFANNGSSASLYQTGGNWDTVYGSNQTMTLNSAQGTIIGNTDFVYMQGASSVTLVGGNDRIVFSQTLGQENVTGFASTDKLQFSVAEFANYTALQSHMTQSGANTIIAYDANDSVTLYAVQKSSLASSQFSFA